MHRRLVKKFTVFALLNVDLVKKSWERGFFVILISPETAFEAGSGVSYPADGLANQFPPVSLEMAGVFSGAVKHTESSAHQQI